MLRHWYSTMRDCDMLKELQQLGAALKRRREEMDVRRAELARHLGVSRSYIGLIEEARPRAAGRGNPSRPGQHLLTAWTRALDMQGADAELLFRWAGYPWAADQAEAARSAGRAMRLRRPDAQSARSLTLLDAVQPSADQDGPPVSSEELHAEVDAVLDLAARRSEGPAMVHLLRSVIALVRDRLERETG